MAQSLARLWTHLIFSTKERYPFLSDSTDRANMQAYLAVLPERSAVINTRPRTLGPGVHEP